MANESTAELLIGLHNAKQSCIEKLANKGVSIDANIGLKDLPSKIDEITTEAVTGTIIDNSVALKKTVPTNSTQYCYLNSIGGMTYKVADTFVATVTEVYGDETHTIPLKIEFEYIPSIPFRLPAPSSEYSSWKFEALCDASQFVQGYDPYYFGVSTVYVNDTILIDPFNTPTGVLIEKISGTLFDGPAMLSNIPVGTQFVCTPSITDTDFGTPFNIPAPLRDTKVTAIKSHGSNLIPFPYYSNRFGVEDVGFTKDWAGLTFTINEDRSISIKGTATGTPSFVICENMNFPNEDLYLSANMTGTVNGMVYVYTTVNGSYYYANPADTGRVKIPKDKTFDWIGIQVKAGTEIDATFRPMLNRGTEALPYKPYREPITYELPQSLINAQTGKGIGEYSDTVDLENGKVITRMKTRKLIDIPWNIRTYTDMWNDNKFISSNGLCSWISYAVKDFLLSSKNVAICDVLPNTTNWKGTEEGINLQVMNNGNHYININIPYQTLGLDPDDPINSPVGTAMHDWVTVTNATLTYALEVPTETDLDAGYTPLIEVDGGGCIEFVNEYGKPVPSTVTFSTTVI